MTLPTARAGRWAWVGRAFLLVALAALGAYATTDPITFFLYGSYAIVGAFLVVRSPRNVIGWMLLGIGFGFVGTTPPTTLDVAALEAGDGSWVDFLIGWISAWSGSLSICLYIALSHVFPSGRLPTARVAGRVAGAMLILAAAVLALTAFGPTLTFPIADGPSVLLPNRFDLLGWLPLVSAIPPDILFFPLLLILLVSVVALLGRYRRAVGVLRLQLRWLVAAVAFVALAVLFGLTTLAIFGGEIGIAAWLPALVAYPSIPAAVAVAVLRYRLYEIDRIISRTIAWALVTTSVVGTFAGGVLLLQAALSGVTQGQTLAVAASTLAAFALFQPLRGRIQHAVDRRFDRARYDGERIVDAFGRGLRQETDIRRVTTNLGGTARSAVAPTSFSIWLRPRGGSR
jgi:hypothetical protein